MGGPDDSDQIKIYAPKLAKQRFIGAFCIFAGLFLLLRSALSNILDWWFFGNLTLDGIALFGVAFFLVFASLGFLSIFSAIRRLPRLIVSPEGIELHNVMRSKWAKWDSLDPFWIELRGRYNNSPVAVAKIVGSNAKGNLLDRKSLSVSNSFHTPIKAIAHEMNAARAAAVGTWESKAL